MPHPKTCKTPWIDVPLRQWPTLGLRGLPEASASPNFAQRLPRAAAAMRVANQDDALNPARKAATAPRKALPRVVKVLVSREGLEFPSTTGGMCLGEAL